jgi:hypothetical protein
MATKQHVKTLKPARVDRSGLVRSEPAATSPWNAAFARWNRDPRRAAHRTVALLVVALTVFSIAPIVNNLRGIQNKDYNLWYQTGQITMAAMEIYPTDHRPFPFMYPPTCAAMLAFASVAGETPFVVFLLLLNSGAWVGSILLSVYLATGRALGQHPLLYFVPTLIVIPFVHDMFLLGQPGLLLLVCLLGAFACLRLERPWSAGALVAIATGIKAFPILAVGYLIYRRQWKATAATFLALAFLLLVLPIPLRGVRGTWNDLSTWTRGMILKYDEGSIAQRPERSYSFKNQSLVAVANRLLRSIPADGEAKDGWQINIADLDFRSVNALIILTSLGICGFYLVMMPRRSRRTDQTDAIETAMLLILIVTFTPLSFDYSYVWLIYPLTITVHWVLEAPARSPERTARLAAVLWFLVVFSLSLPFRRTAQACGNLLAAGLLLLLVLGWQMTTINRKIRPQMDTD